MQVSAMEVVYQKHMLTQAVIRPILAHIQSFAKSRWLFFGWLLYFWLFFRQVRPVLPPLQPLIMIQNLICNCYCWNEKRSKTFGHSLVVLEFANENYDSHAQNVSIKAPYTSIISNEQNKTVFKIAFNVFSTALEDKKVFNPRIFIFSLLLCIRILKYLLTFRLLKHCIKYI